MQNKNKVIKKIILLGLLSLSPLLAVEEANIKSEMSSIITSITQTIQNKSFTLKQKKEQIIPMLNGIFNYQTMSKIALGKTWKTLSATQQNNFIQRFERKLQDSYFEKLELYTNEKIFVKRLEKVKTTRIKLYTEIIGAENNYELIYKFYKVKNSNDWLVYDVEITGVSIIQTYRKQFSEFLKTKSFSDLLSSL